MSRTKPLAVAAVLAMTLAMSLSGTAAAHVVTKDTGVHGTYDVIDFDTQGGGQCRFGPPGASKQFMRAIWFLRPEVYARNINSNRNQQKVKLTYKLQHRKAGSQTKWITVASKSQTKTAYDDTRAPFTSATVYSPADSAQVWRGLVNLKWMRNGIVEGQVSYVIEWYSVRWEIGDSDHMFTPWCPGEAK